MTRPEDTSPSKQSSLSLSLPCRVPLRRRRRVQSLPYRRLPPLRFRPLRRVPGERQLLIPGATIPRVRALSAFLTLPGPCSARRLPAFSCRSRPWGCTLQGRNPLTEPHLLSEAVALVRLTDRAATVPTTAVLSRLWEKLEHTMAPDDGATPSQPHYRALLPASVCTPEPVV